MTQTKQWAVSEPVNTEKNAFTIIDENGIYVAEMFCGGEGVNQAEPEDAEANARLIASAPELLEALKESVAAIRRMDRKLLEITKSPFECEKGEIVRAEQAIANAEGK